MGFGEGFVCEEMVVVEVEVVEVGGIKPCYRLKIGKSHTL